jgi:6-phosphogluconolactonase (cycloisomerase 2 family)
VPVNYAGGSVMNVQATQPFQLVVSPDNNQVYTVLYCDNASVANNYQTGLLTMLARNSTTGKLTTYGIYNSKASGGANGPTHLAISPDGTSIYVSHPSSGIVSAFSRNTSNGTLTGVADYSLASCSKITISSDNKFVYVCAGGITQYTRNLSTGVLTLPVNIVTSAGPTNFLIHPVTGTYAWAICSGGQRVDVFNRDTTTGALSISALGAISTDVSPYGACISPDGNYIYVACYTTGTIKAYYTSGISLADTRTTIVNPYGVAGVVVTADGLFVYGIVMGSPSYIYQYSRNISTGVLTQIGIIRSAGHDIAIALSPDQASIYASSYDFGVVTQFSRDTGTGLLSPLTNGSEIFNGTSYSSMAYESLSITPDGLGAYHAGGQNDVYIYDRDVTTGKLSYNQRLVGFPYSNTKVACSPDNKNIYVLCSMTTAVYIYTRNLTTNTLTQYGSAKTVSNNGQQNIKISPDGLFVYVTNGNQAIYSFSRDPSTGALTAMTTITTAWAHGAGVLLEISADGKFVYIGDNTTTIYQFSRDLTTGILAALSPASIAAPGGTGASTGKFIVSSDNLSLYITKNGSGGIQRFNRDVVTGQLTSISLSLPAWTSSQGTVTITPDGKNMYAAYSASAYTGILEYDRGVTGDLTLHTTVTFTASCSTLTLTVTSVTAGTIYIGLNILGPGASSLCVVSAFVSGTMGGPGVYTLTGQNYNVGSSSWTGYTAPWQLNTALSLASVGLGSVTSPDGTCIYIQSGHDIATYTRS